MLLVGRLLADNDFQLEQERETVLTNCFDP